MDERRLPPSYNIDGKSVVLGDVFDLTPYMAAMMAGRLPWPPLPPELSGAIVGAPADPEAFG